MNWLNLKTRKTSVSKKNNPGRNLEHQEAIELDYIYEITKKANENEAK